MEMYKLGKIYGGQAHWTVKLFFSRKQSNNPGCEGRNRETPKFLIGQRDVFYDKSMEKLPSYMRGGNGGS